MIQEPALAPRFGCRVLVVDDDPDVRGAVADVLQDARCSVALAGNGREAIDALERGVAPELILLDITMPVMDGWAFLEWKRTRPELATVPTVVLSAARNIEQRTASLGAACRVAKPVTMRGLLEVVGRYCA
jgi:CheY-like chemotaxis protein